MDRVDPTRHPAVADYPRSTGGWAEFHSGSGRLAGAPVEGLAVSPRRIDDGGTGTAVIVGG